MLFLILKRFYQSQKIQLPFTIPRRAIFYTQDFEKSLDSKDRHLGKVLFDQLLRLENERKRFGKNNRIDWIRTNWGTDRRPLRPISLKK